MLQLQDITARMQALDATGEAYALATVVRVETPAAARIGAKALVLQDGSLEGWIGGGCAQPAVRKTALECLQDGQARLIRVRPESAAREAASGVIDFPMSCPSEGTLEIFIDPVLPNPVLGVYGHSPIAEALVALGGQLGFRVVQSTEVTPAFIVIASQGQGDLQALTTAVESGCPYIAFVASARKAAVLKQSLKDKGLDAARVDAIHAPAGLDIGATTPHEIALSVLAALITERRRGRVIPTEPALKSKLSAHAAAAINPAKPAGGSCCSSGLANAETIPVASVATKSSCCGS